VCAAFLDGAPLFRRNSRPLTDTGGLEREAALAVPIGCPEKRLIIG
jgi:hypothetical protein